MNILVVGGGGREHALAWKIAQSPRVARVFVAPGNGGTATDAENVDLAADDVPKLLKFLEPIPPLRPRSPAAASHSPSRSTVPIN